MGSGHHTDKDRILAVLKINSLMFLGELIVGLRSDSWSMLSDSLHLSIDILASLVSYFPELNISRFPKDKLEKISNQISRYLFFAAAILVAREAGLRLVNPPEVKINFWFFLIAAIGLFGNLYSFLVLKREKGETISYRRKLLSAHMLVDVGGSIVVIASGIGVWFWSWPTFDPIMSFILAVLIFISPFLIHEDP